MVYYEIVIVATHLHKLKFIMILNKNLNDFFMNQMKKIISSSLLQFSSNISLDSLQNMQNETEFINMLTNSIEDALNKSTLHQISKLLLIRPMMS